MNTYFLQEDTVTKIRRLRSWLACILIKTSVSKFTEAKEKCIPWLYVCSDGLCLEILWSDVWINENFLELTDFACS